MKSTGTLAKIAGLLVTIGLLAGCAAQQQVAARRYFWPPLPDTPRIEWLGAYQSQLDLRPPGPFAWLLGEDEPHALDKPLYIASDGAGRVFVSDVYQLAFFVFDFNKKDVRILGGEKASNLYLHPTGVDLDADGKIYTADNKKKSIFVHDRDENIIGALDLSSEVKTIGAFAIDKARKRIVVPDPQGHKVALFDFSGKLLFSFGKRGSEDGEFNFPISVAVGKDGEIFVCDSQNARIQRFSAEGKFLAKFGNRGDMPGEFGIIKGVAVDSENHVYVTDGKGNNVSIFSDKGDLLLNIGAAFAIEPGAKITPAGFLIPQGIYIDGNDTVFVVDQLNRRFQKFQYINARYLKENPIPGYVPPADASSPTPAAK